MGLADPAAPANEVVQSEVVARPAARLAQAAVAAAPQLPKQAKQTTLLLFAAATWPLNLTKKWSCLARTR